MFNTSSIVERALHRGLAALAFAVAFGSDAASAQTAAGTVITNIATVRYDADGGTRTIQSNRTTLIVAERLDVTLARDGNGPVAVPAAPVAVPLMLVNDDNGAEAFAVAATVSSSSTSVLMVAVDADGNGRYDPAKDAPLANGETPVLAPGQSVKLLAIVEARDAATPADGALTVTAQAATGSGQTGRVYPGDGDGGGDAVVGRTGASASVVVPLTAMGEAPSLVKSQSVLAADGTPRAIRDAVVTYTLEAHFPQATLAASVDDPLPTGTVYVPGSLRLDGAALSDAGDGDAGSVDTAVHVALGDVAAAAVRTIQFKVKIQ